MIFAPEANQGPMVGIFISGPGGVALGALLFVLSKLLDWSNERQWKVLKTTGAVLVIGVLSIFIFKVLKHIGVIYDAKLTSCTHASERKVEILNYWRKRIANTTWAKPRDNWEAQMSQELAQVDGIILDVVVSRLREIRHRSKWRFWGNDQFEKSDWKDFQRDMKFFFFDKPIACSRYLPQSHYQFYSDFTTSKKIKPPTEWPPLNVDEFMHYPIVQNVPIEYLGN